MEIVGPGQGTIFQPWNQIMFPIADARPYGVATVRALPGVAKALSVIGGVLRQMPLDDVKEGQLLTRPRILEKPDPDMSRSRLVGLWVDDYLLHGNAIAAITSRDHTGWPSSLGYVPAKHVTAEWDKRTRRMAYRIGDRLIPADDMIHIARGSDPDFPWRGQGIIEQHMDSLQRAGEESAYSRNILSGSGVPSVVVIAPNANLSQDEADAAKESWMENYGGPVRRPAVLPHGTEVKPLAWSPTDAQLVEARQLTRNDIADIFGLDGYWLGAEAKGLTYRSAAPLYLNLVRATIEPIAQDFEQPLSDALLPPGRGVRFDRSMVLRDDMAGEVDLVSKAMTAGLMTWEEARERLGKSSDAQHRPEVVDARRATPRDLAEMVQKIYLGVNKVLSADEARAILNDAGAELEAGFVPTEMVGGVKLVTDEEATE